MRNCSWGLSLTAWLVLNIKPHLRKKNNQKNPKERKKARCQQYHYFPAVLRLCEPGTGPAAQDSCARVPSAGLLLGLRETLMLWLRGSSWGSARGGSCSEREHASAVVSPQAILRAPSTCSTCPTDAPSATSLPGSQVLFEISASDCQSPECDLGPFVFSNKFWVFF